MGTCASKTPLTAWDGVRMAICTRFTGIMQKATREQLEEIQEDEAIWPETIARFRKRVAPGAVYYYRDEEGVRRRTKVTDTRCPHICLFDNGQAYSWADVIRCSRKGTHTLGEWPK